MLWCGKNLNKLLEQQIETILCRSVIIPRTISWLTNVRKFALGIGHWALGIGHWALGIGHWAWVKINSSSSPAPPAPQGCFIPFQTGFVKMVSEKIASKGDDEMNI
jgi:hypothetical protein